MTSRLEFRPLAGDRRAGGRDESELVEVVFPRDAAEDANAAMDRLYEVFPDHQPSLAAESPAAWTFRLSWASDPAAFVDPGVREVAARMYGIRLPEIGGYFEAMQWGGRDVVFSLVHGWALLAAALAAARRGGKPLAWVVHLDDHTDLGTVAAAPAEKRGFLTDRIFAGEIDLGDPASVAAAVERGTVSKGNFLTAYLLGCPETQVVHVGAGVPERSFAITPRDELVYLGGPPLHGSAIPLVHTAEPGVPTFLKTRSLPQDLPSQGAGGVWLDIDLDYFCNRFDGDSDRRTWRASPGERQAVIEQVNRFLLELGEVRWLDQVEAVSVAVSPGFFPADHWEEVMSVLKVGIQQVLER